MFKFIIVILIIVPSNTSYAYDRNCSGIMEWANEESLVNARPQMIAFLDTIRDILDEISDDLGVTDPASGPLIIDQSGLVTEPGKTISGKIKA
tara:strand:+ start:273 stop:551 length:279 start_codon:yes stop_codon:yes gene_type:complete